MLERKYEYKNGIIYIRNLDKLDTQKIHKATESFLRKVIAEREGRKKNGNIDKSRDF